MKRITSGRALHLIQEKKNIIIRCNKTVFRELKSSEGQTFISIEGKQGIITIKNKIVVHPKIKFIYLYE